MKLTELFTGLNAIYPTRYSHFSSPQARPFICFIDNGSDSYFADNQVIFELTSISIELYTDSKDLEAERKIRQFLKENEIPYERSPTFYIGSEQIYKTTYEVSIYNDD